MIARHLPAAVLVVACAAVALPASAQTARPTVDRKIAVLQALDKITARVSEFDVPVGDEAAFGTLDITVRACRSTMPEEAPEDAVFLEVFDEPPGGTPGEVFSGWMFASSPAVSALEHPVYDLRLVDCADQPSPPPAADVEYERGIHTLPDNPPLPPERPDGQAL